MYNLNRKEVENQNILFLIALSPSDLKIKITSNTNWNGYYSDSFFADIPVSGSGNQIFRLKGRIASAEFYTTSAGFLTLQLYADDQCLFSETVVSTFNYIGGSIYSKRPLLLSLYSLIDKKPIMNYILGLLTTIIIVGCAIIALLHVLMDHAYK